MSFKAVSFAAVMFAGIAGLADAHPRSWAHDHSGYSNSYGGYNSGYSGGYTGGYNDGYSDGYYDGTTVTRQARVVQVEPVYEYRRRHHRPAQVCHVEQVPVYGNVGRSYHSQGADPGGALVGALVGGFIGNQVTNHDEAGTIFGAISGAVIGSQVGQGGYVQNHQGIVGYENREVCKTVEREGRSKRVLKGYNVTYRYHGQRYQTFTDYDPGQYITIQVQR